VLDEGCDPAAFAAQIRDYLADIAAHRRTPAPPAPAPVPVTPPAVTAPETILDDQESIELNEFLECLVERPEPAAHREPVTILEPIVEPMLEPLVEPAAHREPATILEPLVIEALPPALIAQPAIPPDDQPAAVPAAVVAETAPVVETTPPVHVEPAPSAPLTALAPAAPPVVQQPANVQVLTIPAGNGTQVQAAVNVAVAVSVQVAASVTVATPPPRPRKPRPVQDEWGLFDPSQCGFPALMARLDEMAKKEESDDAP
jgi:hypothetical protein